MAVPSQPTPPAHRLVGGITDAELERRICLALGNRNSEWLIALEQNWPGQFLRITKRLGVEAPAAPTPPPPPPPPPPPVGRHPDGDDPAWRGLLDAIREAHKRDPPDGRRRSYSGAAAVVAEEQLDILPEPVASRLRRVLEQAENDPVAANRAVRDWLNPKPSRRK